MLLVRWWLWRKKWPVNLLYLLDENSEQLIDENGDFLVDSL